MEAGTSAEDVEAAILAETARQMAKESVEKEEFQEIELPGDVYASCWERHQLPPCTLIKLPHQGHGDALTSRLQELLRPRYAVISVSDDRTDDCPIK